MEIKQKEIDYVVDMQVGEFDDTAFVDVEIHKRKRHADVNDQFVMNGSLRGFIEHLKSLNEKK